MIPRLPMGDPRNEIRQYESMALRSNVSGLGTTTTVMLSGLRGCLVGGHADSGGCCWREFGL
jgi:hypothetical protein